METLKTILMVIKKKGNFLPSKKETGIAVEILPVACEIFGGGDAFLITQGRQVKVMDFICIPMITHARNSDTGYRQPIE
jgi:hypothetical protein